MKIETKTHLKALNHDTSRLEVEVFVDGLSCGKVTIAAGPKHDVEDLFRGDVTLNDLATMWARDL